MRRVPGAFGGRNFLCLFLLSLLFATAEAQQQRQRFELIAVDASGAVIPAATVIVQADGIAKPAATGASNSAGEFGASVLPGVYRVTLTHDGFETVEQRVDVASGQDVKLTIILPVLKTTQSLDVHADGLKADLATSATRMPMTILETPQQIQVLTGELLHARAAESMKQAVEMVPSVGLQLGEGRRDNFFIRGFNAVNDMYIDGVRDGAQYYRDLSNTERIEVLEGPAAVLYGRGSSGGLINRVTKKPSMEGTLTELSYTAGGYGEQRGIADLDTIVRGTNGKLGFRLTGAAEHEGSQRHFYWEDRYTFAPTLLWKPSEASAISLQVERLRDDRLPDRGIPYLPATGAPAAVSVGNFYGYVGPLAGSNFIHSAVTDGTVDARHAFADGWNLHAVQRLAGYNTNFANMYPTAVTATGGGYLVARGEYHGTQLWTNADSTVEAYRTARFLGMQHMVLVGVEYGREVTDSTQYNGPTNQTPVSLLNPIPTAPILSTVLSRNNRFLGQTVAAYVQDLVTIAPRWKALVGVRFDDFRQTLELLPPTNTTANLGRTDYAASPRLGVVYQARTWASVYGNYSRTFDPSGEGLSLATNNAQLEPEVTQNYELGGKANLLRDRLLGTASVFRLDRTNIKTTDPNNPLALLNLGEQRTNGAEVNLQGAIARRWQVYGGYAWLDGRIVSSTTLSNGVSLQGRRPAMAPLHGGSVWTTYSFENGFGFGGGIVSRAKQFAATDNLARLPAYARVDASVFYRRARYEIQANIQNLGNVKYYDAAQSDYQIFPAEPINAAVTARWRF
ncbi:MAG TPA: TonB-dependent siderophore receptor [Acidobacteriaceae bacterium]